MDGKITRHGALEIKRGREYLPQICVDSHQDRENAGQRLCGHYCPFFREDVPAKQPSMLGNSLVETGKRVLMLCKGPLVFDKLEDNR